MGQAGGQLPQIQHPRLDHPAPGEQQELPGKASAPLGGQRDLVDVVQQRIVEGEGPGDDLAVAHHHHQDVVEVVGHPAGQPPDALQLLRLQELFFQPLALGDVGGDPAAGHRAPLGVVEGELDRDVGVQPVVLVDLLLLLQRSVGLQHLQVVGPEGLGLLGEQLEVGLAPDGLLAGVEQLLEAAVDQQVAPLGILDGDDRRRVVDDPLQQALAGPQLVGGPGQLGGPVPHPVLEVDLGPAQGLLGPAPLARVAHGPHQPARVDHPLDQIVLGPDLHRLDGDLLVGHDAEHDHHRHVGGPGVEAAQGLQPHAVGQAQVEEDDVGRAGRHPGDGGGQRLHALHLEGHPPRLLEQLSDQPGVGAVVLDDQGLDVLDRHLHSRGRATMVSQNSSIIRITRMKASNSTGLVT